jgi:P-type E1-E2 ATPase
MARLRQQGMRLLLVSGDEREATEAVARRIGIDEFYGRRRPEEKADLVRKLQASGARVAVVGDGINDAPALAVADLAVAVHGNAPLGREAADVTLMTDAPDRFGAFLALAGRVNRKVRQNLVGAMFYNGMALPIAASGLLTPLVAVCAMLASSLTVIGNTLLLLREKGE